VKGQQKPGKKGSRTVGTHLRKKMGRRGVWSNKENGGAQMARKQTISTTTLIQMGKGTDIDSVRPFKTQGAGKKKRK